MNSARISAIPASPASQEESAGRSAFAIAMYCVLLLSYVLMAADRYLFPVLAVDVRRDFGLSLANAGLLTTIFTLGLGVGGLPTGYLLARFSRKAVLLTGIAIFSAATGLDHHFGRILGPALLPGGAGHRHGHAGDVHVCAGRKLFLRDTAPRPSAPSIFVMASEASSVPLLPLPF